MLMQEKVQYGQKYRREVYMMGQGCCWDLVMQNKAAIKLWQSDFFLIDRNLHEIQLIALLRGA